MSDNVKARKKILNLLSRMDRSEYELRSKLETAGFNLEEIDGAVKYAASYGYIDDDRFADTYVRINSSRKSFRRITKELHDKGIDDEKIAHAISVCENKEADLIEHLARKKLNNKEMSHENIQKCKAYLFRQGFSLDDINTVLDNLTI